MRKISLAQRPAAVVLGPAGPVRIRTSMTLIPLVVFVLFAFVQHDEVLLGLIHLSESNWLTAFNLGGTAVFYLLVRSRLSEHLSRGARSSRCRRSCPHLLDRLVVRQCGPSARGGDCEHGGDDRVRLFATPAVSAAMVRRRWLYWTLVGADARGRTPGRRHRPCRPGPVPGKASRSRSG